MPQKSNCPGALAGARRAEVTMLVGKDDIDNNIAGTVELQVRKLLTRYALSLPVATAVAELAFGPRRRA